MGESLDLTNWPVTMELYKSANKCLTKELHFHVLVDMFRAKSVETIPLSISFASFLSEPEVFPIIYYAHSEINANGGCIIGGAVYRGCEFPDFNGYYFFADYMDGYGG